jgi:hypothetical protein
VPHFCAVTPALYDYAAMAVPRKEGTRVLQEERLPLLLMMIPSLLLLGLVALLIALPGEMVPTSSPASHAVSSAIQVKFDPQLPANEAIDDPAARLGFTNDLLPERPL